MVGQPWQTGSLTNDSKATVSVLYWKEVLRIIFKGVDMEYPLLPPEKLLKETLVTPVVTIDNSYLHTVLQGILGALKLHDAKLGKLHDGQAWLEKDGFREKLGRLDSFGEMTNGLMRRLSAVEKEAEKINGLEMTIQSRPDNETVQTMIDDAIEQLKRVDRIAERNEERAKQDMSFQKQLNNLAEKNKILEEQLADQSDTIKQLNDKLANIPKPVNTEARIEALYDVFELDKDKVYEAVEHDKASRPATADVYQAADTDGARSMSPDVDAERSRMASVGGGENHGENTAGNEPGAGGGEMDGDAGADAGRGARDMTHAPAPRRSSQADRKSLDDIRRSQEMPDRPNNGFLDSLQTARTTTLPRPGTSYSVASMAHRGSFASDASDSKRVRLLHNTPALSSIIKSQLTEVIQELHDRLEAYQDNLNNNLQSTNRKIDDLNSRFELQQDLHQRTLSSAGSTSNPKKIFEEKPEGKVEIMRMEPSAGIQEQLDRVAAYLDNHGRELHALNDRKLNVDDSLLEDMRETLVMLNERLSDVWKELETAKGTEPGKGDVKAPSFRDLEHMSNKLHGLEIQLQKLNKYKANRSELNKTKAILRKSQEHALDLAVQGTMAGDATAAVRYKCLSCQGPAERIEDMVLPKPVKIFPPGSVLVSPTASSPKSYIEWANRIPTPKGAQSRTHSEEAPSPSPPSNKKQFRARIVGTDRKIYQGGLGDLEQHSNPDVVLPLEQQPDLAEVQAG
eukprot:TRINITY_DN1241_c0_g1_i4.p1 TRINITY_DN1241_c0_g1~~TRINITY_DN1241_c0_g1_i4.p1  ORF type:complete len:738 (+),score=223.86 TRINITY_DN1241_c0_g1_i4:306-2519(+)